MVSSVLFFLAGRALIQAVESLENWPLWQLAIAAAGLWIVVLAVQFALSLPAARMQPIAAALDARNGRVWVHAAAAFVMAWSSTRSVIALVIALSIPASLPDGSAFAERDLILITAAFLVMLSLAAQGITLRWAVIRADLCDEGEEEREVDRARSEMAAAAADKANGAETPLHDAARRSLLALRERDAIGDEVLARMLRETDLNARASEENVLPGAGPPNP